MGKVVEKKRRKKKGRPSLLDIQKRSLRLQKQEQNDDEEEEFQQQQKRKRNPNPNLPQSRFTRRNGITPANVNGNNNSNSNDDNDEEYANPKEKKLNLVLRKNPNQRSFSNSPYLDPELFGSDLEDDDRENGEWQQLKKRKTDGSAAGLGNGKKEEKHASSVRKGTGTPLESGPTTTLPDKKLLFFILDRLQKKDTYSVFSEPVDPEELPDYHDIIKNPMDFGTVRKKVESGAYANLEEFEKDVLLISSNAMQYNAPDTIYFRQARSIQELAKKNFEELRQDSDDNEPEPKIEPKIVRRGRPPGRPSIKTLKKTLARTSSDFASDSIPARGGDGAMLSNTYLRRGPLPEKYGYSDASRTYHGPRNGETYSRWSAERTSERNDDFHGSSLSGFSMKHGKKHISDERRCDTHMNPQHSILASEPSVLTTFDTEQIQLMPVGFHTEHGFARSLARFAVALGPAVWKVASKKIERALPPGMKFGPGWVGETEAPLLSAPVLTAAQTQLLPQQQSFSLQESSSSIMPFVESNATLLVDQEVTNSASSDCLPSKTLHPPTMTSPSVVVNRSQEPTIDMEADRSLNSSSGFGSINGGAIIPYFQINQSPAFDPTMNGFNGAFGFSNPSRVGNLVRPTWPNGTYSSEPSIHSRMFDMARNSFINSMPANRLGSDNQKLSGNSSTLNSCDMPISGPVVQAGSLVGTGSWQGLPFQQKPDTVPPDLNLRFQSSGSPSSTARVDSPQPDLALHI